MSVGLDIIGRMCIICDGGTHDDVMFDIDAKVSRHGWAVQGVGPAPGRPGWIYTIGLADRFDHPELVVVWCDELAAHGLVRHLAERVAAGERFAEASSIDTEVRSYQVVDVHPSQIEAGLIAMWHNYYGDLGRFDLPQRALQVKATELMCMNHTLHKWSLDRSAPLLNRASAPRRANRPARPRKGGRRE